MGFFKKKEKAGIIDFTSGPLNRIRESSVARRSPRMRGDGIIDFTSGNETSGAGRGPGSRTGSGSGVGSGSGGSSSSNDDFGFLSGFAEASSGSSGSSGVETQATGGSVVDSLRISRAGIPEHARTEINELRIKLDDANFKIDNLIEKVRELEDKIRIIGVD